MLITQTLYRQAPFSISARPETRSLDRHLAPQDFDAHPDRLYSADTVASFGVIGEVRQNL